MTTTTVTVPPAATLASTAAAEWWKLRSLRSTGWFLGGATMIMLLMAMLESNDGDPTTYQAVPVAMAAVSYFVQYILAAFAMLAITSEFATRSITVTLVCTPSRTRIMLAKTAVVGSVVLVAGVLVTGLGVVAGATRFDELGDLGVAQVVAVLKIGSYLALLAVLALGIGTGGRRTQDRQLSGPARRPRPRHWHARATDCRWPGRLAGAAPRPARDLEPGGRAVRAGCARHGNRVHAKVGWVALHRRGVGVRPGPSRLGGSGVIAGIWALSTRDA